MEFKPGSNWWDIRIWPDSHSPFSPPARSRGPEIAVVAAVLFVVAVTAVAVVNWNASEKKASRSRKMAQTRTKEKAGWSAEDEST